MILFSKIKQRFWKRFRETWYELKLNLFSYKPKLTHTSRGVRVLVYHGICRSRPSLLNSRFISNYQFERHLQAIKSCFNAISLDDYKNKRFSNSKLNVLITFDDGLKNNFTQALPLLIKHNIPAVFFVTAQKNRLNYLLNDLADLLALLGPMETKIEQMHLKKRKSGIHWRYFDENNRSLGEIIRNSNLHQREKIHSSILEILSKEQLDSYKEYIELLTNTDIEGISKINNMEVGSHGMTHTSFTKLSNDELLSELIQSKDVLKQHSKSDCCSIAFPYGDYDSRTIEACKKAGYTLLFGTEKSLQTPDKMLINERFTINPFVTAINQMYYIAKGNYE